MTTSFLQAKNHVVTLKWWVRYYLRANQSILHLYVVSYIPMLSLCLPAHSGLCCEKKYIVQFFWKLFHYTKHFCFLRKNPDVLWFWNTFWSIKSLIKALIVFCTFFLISKHFAAAPALLLSTSYIVPKYKPQQWTIQISYDHLPRTLWIKQNKKQN